MTIEAWLAFVAASTVLLIIPGPTILTVISYSISHGYRAKIPLIIAVALGDSTALALSLLGLGALLAKSVFWFQVIKWAGGLYLIYLGIKLFRSGLASGTSPDINKNPKPASGRKLFADTYLVTALNPKGMVFFLAFLPQFVDTSTAAAPQLWILASTFVALATLNASIYALFAGKASELLASPQTQRRFNLAGGSLLTIAGIWTLSAQQS
ncbi:MAG: LysE family translocator [Thiolinea sp.]